MKHIFLKDHHKRSTFKHFEIQQKVIKSLVFNTMLPTMIRRKLN